MKKYLPFWIGLILCIFIIDWAVKVPSFGVIIAFILGYYIKGIIDKV